MKFIQITSTSVANTQATQCNWVLHALDDEGRIWEMDDAHGWREVPLPVPLPPTAEICPNCDSALPQGCAGLFKGEGSACWLNRTGMETSPAPATSSADHHQRTGSPMCWCGHRKASHDHAGCCGICSCVEFRDPTAQNRGVL